MILCFWQRSLYLFPQHQDFSCMLLTKWKSPMDVVAFTTAPLYWCLGYKIKLFQTISIRCNFIDLQFQVRGMHKSLKVYQQVISLLHIELDSFYLQLSEMEKMWKWKCNLEHSLFYLCLKALLASYPISLYSLHYLSSLVSFRSML